ncbi:MAG: hypothetical protein OXH68_13180 [Gammaproteobacteria bacterium]|nr:hypothetical protein [Gammaproteobacteria bacterium]
MQNLNLGPDSEVVGDSEIKPTYEELCRAIEALTDNLVLERNVLYDDWTNTAGEFRDKSDKMAIDELDAEIREYRDLLRRAMHRQVEGEDAG